MRLRQSGRAQADIAAIVEFGVERFGRERTRTYLEQIEACYRQLRDFPESGRKEPDLYPHVRSVSCGSHRIYYSIDDKTITVRRILHKAADAKRWLV
jgi:plasmid stabilization system protein ParE